MLRWRQWMKLCGCLFCCLHGHGQAVQRPLENGYTTAGAYSKHFMDAFSFRANPAGLGNMQLLMVGALTERKWMLKELNQSALAVSFHLGRSGMGFCLQESGDADYNEQELELAYGKNLGKTEIGIRFGYQQKRAMGYAPDGFGTACIGFRIPVSPQLIVGWEIGLPAFVSSAKSKTEKGPWIFKMGFGQEIRPELLIALQIVKITALPVNIIGILEYRYGEHFIVSFAINSQAGIPYFKTGWTIRGLSVQLYTLYEPSLGFSPGLGLFWQTKNKKE
jgi:hypothetical protein